MAATPRRRPLSPYFWPMISAAKWPSPAACCCRFWQEAPETKRVERKSGKVLAARAIPFFLFFEAEQSGALPGPVLAIA